MDCPKFKTLVKYFKLLRINHAKPYNRPSLFLILIFFIIFITYTKLEIIKHKNES